MRRLQTVLCFELNLLGPLYSVCTDSAVQVLDLYSRLETSAVCLSSCLQLLLEMLLYYRTVQILILCTYLHRRTAVIITTYTENRAGRNTALCLFAVAVDSVYADRSSTSNSR